MSRQPLLRTSHFAVGALCAAAAMSAQAQAPTQASITAPGGFISACAYSNSGSGFTPGGDLTALFGASHCNSNFFSGGGSAAASSAYTSGATSNHSQGIVSLGAFHVGASNNAPNSSYFAAAGTNGGWTETQMQPGAPGQTGQHGTVVVSVNVTGSLEAHGFAGSTGFEITAYKNGNELSNSIAGFSPGAQSTPISTDRQRALWSVATYGYQWNDAYATINDAVHFAIPVVFGTPFSFGVYGYALASMRSSSGVAGNSTADLDFMHTVTWGGVIGVYDANNHPLTGYTLTSADGINWAVPYSAPVPEPESWAMMMAGLGLLGFLVRRRRPDRV